MRGTRPLREAGVLGINRRNIQVLQRFNERRLYPLVDDKLRTKRICLDADIPVPGLLAEARYHFEIPAMLAALAEHESFVLKPAQGAMGNGIMVLTGRVEDRYRRAGGTLLTRDDLRYHAAGIISGLYSLGGRKDEVLVEERLRAHPALTDISIDGVPDIRTITFLGVPMMMMMRLPTHAARGRANLHQGAVGVGIDMLSGKTTFAICNGRYIESHPDSGKPVVGFEVPHFEEIVDTAARASAAVGLGYIGVDVVIDQDRGPLVLELNARPGLAIQLANRRGIIPRVQAIWDALEDAMSIEERIALGRSLT